MTRELSPIHDVVQAAALESLKETIGVDTAYEVLSVTGYDTLDHAYYSAAIDRIAELEDQRDALLAACEESASEIEYAHADMLTEDERSHPRGSGWARVYDRLQAAIHAAEGVEP